MRCSPLITWNFPSFGRLDRTTCGGGRGMVLKRRRTLFLVVSHRCIISTHERAPRKPPAACGGAPAPPRGGAGPGRTASGAVLAAGREHAAATLCLSAARARGMRPQREVAPAPRLRAQVPPRRPRDEEEHPTGRPASLRRALLPRHGRHRLLQRRQRPCGPVADASALRGAACLPAYPQELSACPHVRWKLSAVCPRLCPQAPPGPPPRGSARAPPRPPPGPPGPGGAADGHGTDRGPGEEGAWRQQQQRREKRGVRVATRGAPRERGGRPRRSLRRRR